MRRKLFSLAPLAVAIVAFATFAPPGDTACCYFSAKDKDVNQPAQKAFLTYDPATKVETFTVQPKFEGNAADFGMVIPTPAKPKLDQMPRDFFKHLAVYTILKKRAQPQSSLLPLPPLPAAPAGPSGGGGSGVRMPPPKPPPIRIVESGIVGSLEYKIIEADRADDLYAWLKEHRYNYSGDEATLDFYVQKKWLFTVMKIDTAQMKKNADGSYSGDVTPTRFRFASEKFVYPLRITRISVKDKTEALFYVQAPSKCDLEGDWTYQYQWVPMLQNAQGWYAKGIFGTHDLPGQADDWIKAIQPKIPDLLRRGQELGFSYNWGQRPQPNAKGHVATTLEWAKKLTKDDIGVLKGEVAYSETMPDPDAGFTADDTKDPMRAEKVYAEIRRRLAKYQKERPAGYLVRDVPPEDVKALKQLLGHLQEGQFVTKFRKVFAKDEMADDLTIIPARLGDAEDRSEYTEALPTSPP
jgi:Uncharacterized protein conserved in bacteria (DUF2330)